MTEVMARRSWVRNIRQQCYYTLNPIITNQKKSEDDASVDDEASENPPNVPNPLLTMV